MAKIVEVLKKGSLKHPYCLENTSVILILRFPKSLQDLPLLQIYVTTLFSLNYE